MGLGSVVGQTAAGADHWRFEETGNIRLLGADMAGRVEAAGKNVTKFKPGDEVFGDIAESGFGGFCRSM